MSATSAPRRILIVGAPGSGKSTLATALSSRLGIETHSLDTIAYEGEDYAERPLEDRLRDAAALAEQPEWVAEGVHLGWTRALVERADLVVWLDHVGWSRSSARILRRFVTAAIGEARSRRGHRRFLRFGDYGRHLRQLGQVLITSRDFYKPDHSARRYPVTREAIERELAPHADKVVRCRSRSEVQRVVGSFATSP